MDSEAYERLYEACYMRVYSYVMTLAGDRHQAEEITQETFFRAFTRGDGFRGEADEVTWLCAIAKNLFSDELRRRSRAGDMPPEAASPDKAVDQAAVERDASFRVHLALHGLEEPYKEVFSLRVFAQLSFREIGSLFGKNENWACVVYHRARQKLQKKEDTK